MPFGLLVGWGRTARRPYRDRAESVQTTSPRSAPCQSLSISASEAENVPAPEREKAPVTGGFVWCAWQESNLRPCAPEAHALSPELQARGCQSSREESEGGLGAKRRPSSVGTLYPLSYRRPASSVALVDVAAAIETLRLAATVVPS